VWQKSTWIYSYLARKTGNNLPCNFSLWHLRALSIFHITANFLEFTENSYLFLYLGFIARLIHYRFLVGTTFCDNNSSFCSFLFLPTTLHTHIILSHTHPDFISSFKCVQKCQCWSGDGCGYNEKIFTLCCGYVMGLYAGNFGSRKPPLIPYPIYFFLLRCYVQNSFSGHHGVLWNHIKHQICLSRLHDTPYHSYHHWRIVSFPSHYRTILLNLPKVWVPGSIRRVHNWAQSSSPVMPVV
jgi:hypothetical protein